MPSEPPDWLARHPNYSLFLNVWLAFRLARKHYCLPCNHQISLYEK